MWRLALAAAAIATPAQAQEWAYMNASSAFEPQGVHAAYVHLGHEGFAFLCQGTQARWSYNPPAVTFDNSISTGDYTLLLRIDSGPVREFDAMRGRITGMDAIVADVEGDDLDELMGAENRVVVGVRSGGVVLAETEIPLENAGHALQMAMDGCDAG